MRKISRWTYLSVGFLFIGLIFGLFVIQYNQTEAQTVNPKDKQDGVSWTPAKTKIEVSDSALRFTFNGLDSNDWIFGVRETDDVKEATAVVGIVTWETWGDNKRFKAQKISKIRDYPSDLLTSDVGIASLTISDSYFKSNENNESLVVFLEVPPKTKVELWQGNANLTKGSDFKNYMAIGGSVVEKTPEKVSNLLLELQYKKMAEGLGKSPSTKGGKSND